MKGPQRLSAILAQWTPSAKLRGIDAASAVSAAWAHTVGADVARRTRPGQIRDGVLTVYTAGSTWNHQLSFLAPAMLAKLAEACPGSGVKRLRFVVATGRTKALLDGAAAAGVKRSQRGKTETADRASETEDRGGDAGSILLRLRRRQNALDRERARAGWTRCPNCHAWRERGASEAADCAVCRDARRRAIDDRVERVLANAPWLRSADITEHVAEAGEREYSRVRRHLLNRWEEQIFEARRRLFRDSLQPADRVIAWSYLMLRATLQKSDIGRALVVDLLGPDWASQLVDAAPGARQAPATVRENQKKTTARALQRRNGRHV